MKDYRLLKWVGIAISVIFAFFGFFIPRKLPDQKMQTSVSSFDSYQTVTSITPKPLIIPNLGQYPPEVLLMAQQGNLTLWFTRDAVWFSLVYPKPKDGGQNHHPSKFPSLESSSEVFHWKLSFLDGNPDAVMVAESPLGAKFNFFTGDDPIHWVNDVPAYSRLVYRELYPDLDLEVGFDEGPLRWIFREQIAGQTKRAGIKPHLLVEGVEDLQVEEDYLSFQTPVGILKFPLPYTPSGIKVSWHALDGKGRSMLLPSLDEKETKDKIVRIANNSKDGITSFFVPSSALGQDNPDEMVFSTYLGGSGEETAYDIAVDREGFVYVVGSTTSLDFPGASGGYDSQHNGNHDVFVSKLSPDASNLIYSTYIGGSGLDRGYAIEINETGEAIIGGVTISGDFPRTHGTIGGNRDGFALRLSAEGNRLDFSHVMGGSQPDAVNDMVVDSDGAIYLTGETESGDFPIAYGHLGGKDCFVGKLSSTGDVFQSVGLLSGSGDDVCYGIDLHEGDEVTVAGSTTSQNFPTTQGAFSTQYGGETDGFVAYLDISSYLASITYNSYLGGSGWDEVLALDNQGGFYFLTGFSDSTDFPIKSAYDSTFGGIYDAFVVNFHPISGLVFSTYLGGSALDIGRAIAVMGSGEVLVTGNTTSNNFPTTSTALFQTARGGEDVFVTELGSQGDALLYSTYFGGNGNERGCGIALGSDPRPHVVGYTDSDSLLLSDSAVDRTLQGSEAFVLKLALGFFPTPTSSASPSPSPSSTITSLPTSTRTPLPSKTATPTRTASPTRTLTPTRTERPTMTTMPTSTTLPFQVNCRIYIPWINKSITTVGD